MKVICLVLLLLSLSTVFSQSKDVTEIMSLLNRQTENWNKGDIREYMATYWHNDSLMFIGKNGIQWGWQTTLENYKKSYPDTVAMGKLSFNVIVIKKLSPQYFYVVGKWSLKRTIGDLTGHYDLVLRKINGQWVIVADHSS